MTTWYEDAFRPGSEIRGKWNGRVYVVERLLGAGSNGVVALVRRGTSRFALKAGRETVDHQSEINSLHALSLTATTFKHFLVEVDDMIVQDREVPFFVMRYIEGVRVSDYIHKHGQDWIYVIGSNLLKKLTELHRCGYVFGDLKIENMIVSKYGHVDLIDFGGMTSKGRAIKQLTEVYDRGFWKAGERVAEESYDLFSFAILMMKVLDVRDRFQNIQHSLPQNREVEQLYPILRDSRAAARIAPFLQRALNGHWQSSEEAYQYWKRLVADQKLTPSPLNFPWLKICFAASLLLFCATVYIYW
ncbi:protein kinase domain-containing protein [Paenibacillus aestuarii]|uniref:non-specific serine/threonine protein kinase n=1 Tax=Paenibacillus aestuarii TaxID=516965 RepID=A0ABW0KI85_9BACL|nr:protein kinase [Paenibacillus aestuarii]